MREILEVGRYVRTKDGNIGKITEIIDDDIIVTDYEFDKEYPELKYTFDRCEALKSSPNIIDLIEVGDILTINQFNNDYEKVEVYETFSIFTKEMVLCVLANGKPKTLFEVNIKSILTHEQYENNCYRAERK